MKMISLLVFFVQNVNTSHIFWFLFCSILWCR